MIVKLLKMFFKPQAVYAHCDIPCGIYDPHTAQLAAKTVAKMVEKISALEGKMDSKSRNDFVRMVQTKEEHAQLCKKELLILWTDYFKSQHLEQFPDLHTTFWSAAKLCSQNKQNIDLDSAKKLVDAVDKIAEIFRQAEANK